MKKRLLNISIVLLLILSMFNPLYVSASGDLDYVTDAAGLLTEDERIELNIKAEEASFRYECDVLIVTVNDIGDAHIEDYAQAVYDEYNLGYGEDKSGIMLIISMAERDYDIMAHGYGNVAFTDYGKERLADKFLPDLSAANYFKSFSIFIDSSERYLELARDGQAIDIATSDPKDKKKVGRIVLAIVPFLIALFTALMQKGKMKTAKMQTMANAYITGSGLKLTGREDRFLHKNVVRTKRESSSGSSRGTTVNSHGSSHKSGKF